MPNALRQEGREGGIGGLLSPVIHRDTSQLCLRAHGHRRGWMKLSAEDVTLPSGVAYEQKDMVTRIHVPRRKHVIALPSLVASWSLTGEGCLMGWNWARLNKGINW